MKKLMTLMFALSLALGCVSVSFAQETKKETTKTKKEKSKKPAKTHKDTTKK